MKALIQTGSSGRVPVPHEKRFLINLFYGDNLDVMRRHIKDESVDLVYLDPPFNSNANLVDSKPLQGK
jgi:16S rRNA G966 N2-methylase RsmD